ncbi:MAG: hypothetical protein IJ030_02300 [Oscillospiraceae bacterium]|nr:hypothetical protein [Oscillospiraceae bacterium]
MAFAAAVVVYNTACQDSPTCRALQKLTDITVLIYDNSTRDFGNREFCREAGWVYLGGQGNLGLSKAYNACIDYLTDSQKADMLCLFDDDTDLEPAYFDALRKARAQSDGHIFVPMIFAGGQLISPCVLDPGHKVRMFANEQEARDYDGDNFSAINSCMAIDLRVFRDFRYDENIFLDGIDHNFTQQMAKRGEKTHFLDYRCSHAFSGVEKPPKASALVRFRIYAKDYAYILQDNKAAYYRLVGKRALRLLLQYKSPVFLKYLIKPR